VVKLFVAIESLEDGDDFSHAVPGEMVHFPPVVCDCPACGCERSMAGFMSHRATTSFVARDLDVDPASYTDMLFKTLADAGWVTEGSKDDRRWVARWALEHMETAAELPTETPLRFDRDRVLVRETR
jgi:hypothetical protein